MGFVKEVWNREFQKLELKERIHAIAVRLREFLPDEFKTATEILIKAAPKLPEFDNWVLCSYIELFGLDFFDISVLALAKLTKYGTAEFAIRPFVINQPYRLLPVFHRWVEDDNEHIRRLAAEATRPRGVWVPHVDEFKKNPSEVIKLLEILKSDSSLYVRKAVANNLNDISHDNPDIMIKTARRWLKENNPETNWIIKRACRTLIKQGHPKVFPLLGFTSKPKLLIKQFSVKPKTIKIGEKAEIILEIISHAKSNQKLAIDYRVHYKKSNGNLAPITFKFSEKELGYADSLIIKKSHSFKPATTRKLYPGKHKLELMINGASYKNVEFNLQSK